MCLGTYGQKNSIGAGGKWHLLIGLGFWVAGLFYTDSHGISASQPLSWPPASWHCSDAIDHTDFTFSISWSTVETEFASRKPQSWNRRSEFSLLDDDEGVVSS